MSTTYKWERREKKKNSKKNRMPKHGRSILSVIENIIQEKANGTKTGNKRKRKKRNSFSTIPIVTWGIIKPKGSRTTKLYAY